mmetsp:Transcript_334/g.824  ORF Transcript_334/g.824 Transcript_334/m.824 type:complete len:276 (-) Transcript_334:1131-1958(-)
MSARSPTRRGGDTANSAALTAREPPTTPGGTSRQRPARKSESEARTPAQRKAKRDANLLQKKIRAVTKLQAAVRAKKHRKLVEAKKKAGPTGAEFKEALEPYITTAVATAIAVQWDDALTRIIATDENRESFALVNAVGTTMYAAVLYLVLMYVSEYFNRRLLNMIKQALQILVGWMWKGVVAAVDEDMRNLHLRELSGRDRLWAGFGITTAFAIVWAPLFTFVCTAILHTTRTSPKDSFVKHFGGLMLGASALVIGYAWHLALVRARCETCPRG